MLRLPPILIVTIALIAISFPLGIWGFIRLGAPYTLTDCFYETLRLYSFNSPPGRIHWQLELARFLSAGAILLGVGGTIYHLFRQSWREFRLRSAQGHIIIAGSTPSALALASDLLSEEKKLAILSPDRDDTKLAPLEKAGAVLIDWDDSQGEIPSNIGLTKASHFLAFTDDDARNAQLCLAVEKQIGSRGPESPLQCHVLLQHRTFLQSFRNHSLLTNSLDGMDVSLFHPGELGARLAFQQHPLEVTPAGELKNNLALTLFEPSQAGFAYLRQALQIGQYGSFRKLSIQIVTSHPKKTELRLADQFPSLEKITTVRIIASADNAPNSLAKAFLDSSPNPDDWHTLVCASDNDELNLGLSQHLQLSASALPCQILCVIQEHEELAEFLSAGKKGLPEVSPVLMGHSLLTWDQVVEPTIDHLACYIHRDYLAGQKERGKLDPQKASHRSWENLGESFKAQNRLQADHIPIKLRAIGLDPEQLPSKKEIAAQLEVHLEELSAMEHDRWNAAHYLLGWTHAPGDKNEDHKTSPYLVPWNDLPEEIQGYDSEAVRNIPNLVFTKD